MADNGVVLRWNKRCKIQDTSKSQIIRYKFQKEPLRAVLFVFETCIFIFVCILYLVSCDQSCLTLRSFGENVSSSSSLSGLIGVAFRLQIHYTIPVNHQDIRMSKQELQRLESKRAHMTTRIFRLGIEIAIIFAAPALIVAFLVGPHISSTLTYILLACTFVFSWIIVIARYKQMHRIMTKLDADIKQLRTSLEEASTHN